jgi:YggT family protein
MFAIGNVILGIARVLGVVLNIYMWVIIIRALLSWVNPDPYNPIVQIIVTITEPILKPIRSVMPRGMMIDFTPMIAIILLQVIGYALARNLA